MKNRKFEEGSHHVALVLIAVVGILGVLGFVGYNALQRQMSNAAGETTVGTARPIVYDLISRNDAVDGSHTLTTSGTDVYLGDQTNTYDASTDGKWLLTSATVDGVGMIGALSTTTKEFTGYIPEGRRCYAGTMQDRITPRFAPSKSSTTPPAIYYSAVAEVCRGLVPQSAAVYRVEAKGANKKTLYRSTTKGVSAYLSDVALNETIAVHRQMSSNDTYGNALIITKAGEKYSFKGATNLALSRNGRKLVYYNSTGSYTLATVATGSKKALKLGSIINDVTLNNDGTKVAYLNGGTTNKQKLYVYTVSSGAKTLLDVTLSMRSSDSSQSTFYDWSSDGSKLVYEYIDRINKKYQFRVISSTASGKKVIKTLNYADTSFAILHWR